MTDKRVVERGYVCLVEDDDETSYQPCSEKVHGLVTVRYTESGTEFFFEPDDHSDQTEFKAERPAIALGYFVQDRCCFVHPLSGVEGDTLTLTWGQPPAVAA